ncbi:MAG TPA: ABC transporter permease [Candidatus Paceibacterota bacterium]|jgi:ABC-2 type transport system permease protein|nr:ABC transporter permease [Candidatus Paceibacterota bacterium]
MNLKRTWAIFLRQLYIIRNLPSRVVPYFLWAVLDVVMWGFITRYLFAVGAETFSIVPTLLGAVILWDFLSRVRDGITIPFLEDVWTNNLLNIFASPLRLYEYIGGFVIMSITTSIFGLAVMLVLARFAFGFSLFSLGLALAPFFLILLLFGIALGILSASIVFRFGPYAEWFVWPIPAVLNLFVGVFYPVSVLPGWMQLISYALPPTYVFEGMRSVLLSGTLDARALALGFALTLVYILLAYGVFWWVYRLVVRSGLLSRFSAGGA